MTTAYYQGPGGEYYPWTPQMVGSENVDGLVQATSFELPDGKTMVDYASTHQSFAGAVQTNDGTWYNILSIRHRNNTNDGPDYGMMLYAPLTDPTGSLAWKQQTGKKASWGNKRTIADSQNPEIVVSSSQPSNPNAKIWVQI